jgi:inosine-uridine nucleoside N-ribohydrolase
MRGIRARFGRVVTVLLAGALLSALASCGAGAAPARGPAPVIVDTDMASDDIMALSYLLDRPDISVQAVTVEGTGVAHGPAGARNVLRLLRALGIHRTIPVGYGGPTPLASAQTFPLAWRNTADGMYNLNLPAWHGPQPSESAVRLLIDNIRQSARPVELITLGPFTNIALALQADPGIAHKIAMIYSMAGAVRVAGNEPAYSRAEWNVYVDAAAASQVLRSGIPMTFVPLDAANNVPITTCFQKAVQAQPGTPALRLIGTMLRDPYYTQTPGYFWDPLAAVAATVATGQQVVRLQSARLVIGTVPGPDMGVTRINPAGSPVHLAVSASAPAFERQFLATLNGGQTVPVPAVPASQRLAVSYDGHTYTYLGPRTAAAGQVEIRLANRSPAPFDGFQLVIGKLTASRTLSDVQEVIRTGTATSVPPWFQVTATLPAAPGANPAWSAALTPGRYALVCVLDRNNAPYALTELTIR